MLLQRFGDRLAGNAQQRCRQFGGDSERANLEPSCGKNGGALAVWVLRRCPN
ncbi:MAG: hypothetical protein GY698_20610 [Actinomycetia bacterium]|nr:hypothetical protein [Actinomycetes bacterium]